VPGEVGQHTLLLGDGSHDGGDLVPRLRRAAPPDDQAAPLGHAHLVRRPTGLLGRPVLRHGLEREPGQQLVPPGREAEREDPVTEPVQARRASAPAGLAQVGGEKAGLFELREVHAGHVRMQMEPPGDVGHGDFRPRLFGDGAVDAIARIVGQHRRKLVVAVQQGSSVRSSADTTGAERPCKHAAHSANRCATGRPRGGGRGRRRASRRRTSRRRSGPAA